MSVINSIPLIAAGDDGYQISRSVRLRSSASAYLNRTPASASNRTTWTWSGWVKLGQLATGTNQAFFAAGNTSASDYIQLAFDGTTQALYVTALNSSAVVMQKIATAVYRDPSAWYHIVYAYDSTQATSTNRIKMYVNGVEITSFSTNTNPAQNTQTLINSANQHTLSSLNYTSRINYFDGYMTEVNFVDGQQLTPSSFGETNAVTGVWQPKKYAGTYGTNGFYLNFSDNSAATATTIGKDYSGNGNNWTPNNISVTAGVTYDSMLDVPTVGATSSNYAVLNPVTAVKSTLLDGNLRTNAGDKYSISTIGVTSGKWYAEMTVTAVGTESSFGIATAADSGGAAVGNNAWSWGYYFTGGKYNNGSNVAYGSSYTTGDVIGCAFDADNGTLTFYKNNVSQGTAFSGLTSGPYFFAMSGRTSGTPNNCSINFGQRPFTYTPPTGFVALNTQNLPAPTISNGAQYMAASLFTGTSGNVTVSNAVNGISFQPDFLWVKARSNAQGHSNADSVRGASKLLQTNLTNAESTLTNPPTFNADGFTSTTDIHTNGYTYVGWQWKAGGTAVSNTSGSITSTVSAGATQGFSVVTYTGTGVAATIGHGLGVAPSMVITKVRSTANNWGVYHSGINDPSKALLLDSTAAAASYGGATGMWNNTAPTSTVFSVGINGSTGGSATYVAYCFAEVAGYSKFGSYTGNGSADGVFVYLGFRPKFIMIKGSSFVSNWFIQDGVRNGYNVNSGVALRPNLSNAEDGTNFYDIDILSNGFKLRTSTGDANSNGATFIFAAFAENPFKNSLAR